MMPAAVVFLDEFPVTPNGRLIGMRFPNRSRRGRRPRPPSRWVPEEILAGIWMAVLGLPAVAREDNFFELGGHSLLATQVMSRVRVTFRVELPLRILFEAPTLSLQARRIREAGRAAGEVFPPIARAVRNGPLPASYPQRRLWFIERLEPNRSTYNVPLSLRVTGRLSVAAVQRSLQAIVDRHESLRTRFEDRDGEPIQVITSGPPLAVPCVDLSDVPPPARERLAAALTRAHADRPFDLARGPIVRGGMLRLGTDDHVLLLAIHHIACDVWSVRAIVAEFKRCYASFAAGVDPALPALPIQYADFAVWQRSAAVADQLERQLQYWRRQLCRHGSPGLADRPPANGATDPARRAVARWSGLTTSEAEGPDARAR
jgi:hypothetical protein